MLLELMAAAIVFSLLTGFLAVVVPALSAANMEPYEAIRRGE
jgi:ABC-type antimicrobial peptide transport system permease subunit